jgi:hypothetical protein
VPVQRSDADPGAARDRADRRVDAGLGEDVLRGLEERVDVLSGIGAKGSRDGIGRRQMDAPP